MNNITINISKDDYELLHDAIKALSNRCYAQTRGVLCEYCTIELCFRRCKRIQVQKEDKDGQSDN